MNAADRDAGRIERDVLDSLLEGCQVIGFDWTYRYVNDALVRQARCSREELIGHTMMECYPGIERTEMFAVLERCMSTRAHDRMENEFTFPDGAKGWFEIRFAPVPEGVCILTLDVTDAKRAALALARTEEQLRQAQKMEALGRLAGSVAHDFNNVLTVIASYASILEEELDPSDTHQGYAVEMRRAGERGAAITRQLLTLSHHGRTAPRTLDLDDVVENLMPMLRRLVGEHVRIVAQREGVPSVVADPGQIEQVLMNLVVNARDAMPDGGRVTIEMDEQDLDDERATARNVRPGRYVVLAVTDTGTGMDVETQRRIFEPFFTTKEAGKGTGLGLSIVHGIVTQAGGTISVYSEPGHGTTFRIHLPASNEAVSSASAVSTVAPHTLPPVTVLVVDDQREVRAVAAHILTAAGCRVLEAATADEARHVCVTHEGALDVAVLDVVLSDGRGDQVARQLRDLRPAIKVVMMSGYPAGALGPGGGVPPELLSKPFSPSELRAAVASVLDRGDERDVAKQSDVADPNRRSRVLVVDDDALVRRFISRVLLLADFDVVDVDGGRAAIAQLGTRPFDVIVSDVNMPDGSGLDLMRAVRRIDLDVPVILMSGQPDVDSAAAAIEYGVFRYLTKPIDMDALVRVVRHAARVHALARLRREAFSITGTQVAAGAADRAGLEVRFEQVMESLWMAFQPIFDATTGALYGVEALLRSSESSMPGPQHVLDAATQLGLLPRLGRRVRSLSANGVADRRDGLHLFVNLHPEDLLDVDLVDEGAALTRIAPRVVLEVTERATLGSSSELSARLARLRSLGFRLAVDDIGAGYSGLTSFTELMPEIVKIDMSLVRDVHLSALKQRTIGALCRLCHEFNCKVVGEGVETSDERECLVGIGVDLLQGYLLGRPVRELPRDA